MSWPADGKPRYVVVETTGFDGARTSGGYVALDKTHPNRTVAVLDRAICHRVVFKVKSEDIGGKTRPVRIATAQRLAAERCAELNAEQVAA